MTDSITFLSRISAGILAAALGVSFISCGSSVEAVTTETQAVVSGEKAVETAAETTTALKDNLPDDLDFGGQTVTFVSNPLTLMHEFNLEALNGDVVDDALYMSSMAVSERLNVKLNTIPIESSYSTQGNFVKTISASVMAGDGGYDFIYGYSMAMATLAADGMLSDLTTAKYTGLDQPWWARKLLDQSTVNGSLYFATGDISPALLYNMTVTFFNKKMLEDLGLEAPYSLVDEHRWTIDALMGMCKGVYSDLNGNGQADEEDRYGLSQSPVFADAFWFSAGLSYTEIGDDGLPRLSEDISSQRASDIVQKLVSIRDDGSHDFVYNGPGFGGGNLLFHTNELLEAPRVYRDLQFDYGIVPVAIFAEGDEYSTCASFTYQLYGIPIDAKDPDMSSVVMEALAFEGYKTVTPALFETALKVKYTSDNDSIRMLDIIRDSLDFDFGRIFNAKLDTKTYTLFRDAVSAGKGDWASVVAKNIGSLEKRFDKLMESFIG